MLINCDTCRAPAEACRDCVMTVLLHVTEAPVELDDSEYDALGSLARAGLVPPLRLVVGIDSGFDTDDPSTDDQTTQDIRVERRDLPGGIRGIA